MKSFSNMSISEKRGKLMELVEMRSNKTRRRKRKNEEQLNIGKEESLPTRTRKIKRKKVKALNQVKDMIAKEIQRVVLDLEGDCFGNQESANEPSRVSSVDEPVDVQRGLGGFCAICMTDGELLLCSGRGCKNRFHQSCLDPPSTNTPPGFWQCGLCTKIKIKAGVHTDADMETNEDDTRKLKERSSLFSTTKIKEYWVPVHLSSTQIEQYCSILDSNLGALSSCTKNISLVHEILTQISKCCDHPYLVDPTLRNSFNRVASIDPLSADIEVSGKLQVLDKLLLEIKQSGLRVVVLFRPGESLGNVSIGDILDDFVHQRFGQDSYAYIPLKVPTESARLNKKESLKTFNCIKNQKFICLVESRGCFSSVPRSNVDLVILFNSCWNPSADIKALHKINNAKNPEQLKVFRLYSPFTVEEKSLFFSKNGAPLHTRMHNINWTTCNQLLSWGAPYLFKDPTFESSFIDDLFHELLPLLKNPSGKTGPTKCPVISNAEIHDGSYSKSIMLLGETGDNIKESLSNDENLIKNGFSVFWKKMLKNSRKRSSRKVRMSLFEGFGGDIGSLSIKRKARSKRNVQNRSGQSSWAGVRLHVGGRQLSEISPILDQGETRRESPCLSPTEAQLPNARPKSISEPLEAESERIQKEQEQENKLHREKKSMLLSECEKEISEIRKKYEALINESETCLAKERKIREDYRALVDANKLLAEILAQKFNESLNPNPNITEKETSSLNIHHIPASTLIRPANPCSTGILTTHFSGHSFRGSRILAQKFNNTLSPNIIEKETSSLTIHNIPASTLIRPANPCSGHSLRGSGIRAPPPHLRSNPLFFSSFRTRPTTLNPFLEPFLTQSTHHT